MEEIVKDSTGGAMEDVDTFDNAQMQNPQAFDTPQEEELSTPPQAKEVKETTQTEQLEEIDEKPSKDKEGEEEQLEVEEKAEEGDGETEPKGKEEPKRAVGGKVKGRIGDKTIEFDPETEVRVKVDGKYRSVPISEMRDAYSSSAHIDERFEDLTEREEFIQREMDDYTVEREDIMGHLQQIGSMLDDEDANPMDALYYLLDMTGRNRNDYERKVLHHHLDEVENLQLMSDSERKAYFLERENEYLKEQHESSTTSMRETEEEKAFVENLNAQREALDVSEGEFEEAYMDLLELGEDQSTLTADTVLEYATLYPIVEEAEEIVSAFDPDILDDDDIVRAVAETILEDPDITQEEIYEALEESFGAEEVSDPKQKQVGQYGEAYYSTSKPSKKTADKDDEEKIESFDDFDHYSRVYGG